MARENFTNFATSALSAAIVSTSALSFSVTTSQGQLFPASNFLCTIDTEVLLIASVSGDTFTVASGGRGYDGTIAATHNNGATVQLSICAFNFVHLWQNIADTYTPQVPPIQLGVTPSVYDNEFESLGNWALFPSPGGGTAFNVNTTMRSHLLLDRGSSDAGLYTAYVGFGLTTAFTVTCRVSQAISVIANTSVQAQCCFFVSDQINPSASADSGNRFRIDVVQSSLDTNGTLNYGSYFVRTVYDQSGAFHTIGNGCNIPFYPGSPLFLRIAYDGAGTYTGYVGDGLTFYHIARQGSLPSPQSLGFSMQIVPNNAGWIPQTVAVDYVRVTGQFLSPYGITGY